MFSRRHTLKTVSAGFGYLAFADLLHKSVATELHENSPLAPRPPHFPARAKRVIFLCMQGGPSHVDSFDYKPQLQADHGKAGRYGGSLLKSPWEFRQRGDSGLWISDLFPEVASMADDLTLIRSMQCDQPVHPGAMTQMHTGTAQFIRPSLGAWTLYGLGTENASLPGFVSLSPPSGSARNYGSAFLPAIFGGAKVGRGGRSSRAPRLGSAESVPDIKPAVEKHRQRANWTISKSSTKELEKSSINQVSKALLNHMNWPSRCRMQCPEIMDVSKETPATLELYGADSGPTQTFGQQCLLARRFAEAGVRFIEVTHGNWDQHANLTTDHKARAEGCDKPIAGLLKDLKQRDMLKDTLVIWGGEFGRTPAAQGADGRNHNNKGYTTWMAGGGVKGGFSYGSTDEHGYEAIENPCHIHDWHATILHLLGLDHERLTYRYAGRDFRLTDVSGVVAQDIIA